MDFLKLKSGTDVRGAAMEIPGVPVELTDQAVEAIAAAFLVWCEKHRNIPASGLASTPSMFMAVLDLPCDCAVQITASHHPWHRNGLKFFAPDGGLDGPDIAEILTLAQQGACPPLAEGGSCQPSAHMDQYAAHLRRLIQEGIRAEDHEHPLKGFRIAVDAGNGAGGFYARMCPAVNFWTRTAAFPTTSPTRRTRRPWPLPAVW